MPPITIQTDKPINPSAAKPDGTTPQTAQPPSAQEQASASYTTTTTDSRASNAYAPAQPGAAAFPAPTSSSSLPAAQRTQYEPTRTSNEPPNAYVPAPQAGSFPDVNAGSVPPPQSGRSGAAHIPPATTAPATLPPQFTQPPPAVNAASTHSTTTYQPPSYQPPSAFQAPSTNTAFPPGGPLAAARQGENLAHPPGYVQNPYADTQTPAQRAATEKAEQEGSVLGQLAAGGSETKKAPLSGVMDGSSGSGLSWDAAKKWIGEVGGKVAELEGEVWKKIDGK